MLRICSNLDKLCYDIKLMVKKLSKIVVYNCLVLFFSIFFIEIIFGGWFKKDNLGGYFREHRMKKVPYSVNYAGKIYDYIYLRNYNGFIGEEINLDDIHSVFIGGSTADERWKPRNLSILEQINNNFKDDSINIKITNAGIEGQTTVGYIANFKYWFPRLKNFKPKNFIFYTGINDLMRDDFKTYNYSDGFAKLIDPNPRSFFLDGLKSKSFFYDKTRKIKHKYYTRDKKIFMDLDKMMKNYPNSNYSRKMFKDKYYDYLIFNKAEEQKNMKELLEKEKEFIDFYLKNIDILANYSKKFSANPIFINQVSAYGAHIPRHLILNYALKKHCIEKKYDCIDLASKFEGKLEYWYDGIHTTPLGSKVIADEIYPFLKRIIN